MSTTQILFAGFGGQGILFSGKFMAYKGLLDDKHVSWLPSYGPEMRGGTANCSVIISDTPVGSPIVSNPDILVAMNLPSLEKYENAVVSGGMIFVDSTLIEKKVERTDVSVFYVPATKIASDNEMPALANMIIMGKMLKEMNLYDVESIQATLKKIISARKQGMFDINLKAIELGTECE